MFLSNYFIWSGFTLGRQLRNFWNLYKMLF